MQHNLVEIEKQLDSLRDWLLKEVGRRDEIVIQQSVESLDKIQSAIGREMAIMKLNRDATMLQEVNDALGRIRADRYGRCLVCQQRISAKRLKAVPWAALCLECQTKRDTDQNISITPNREADWCSEKPIQGANPVRLTNLGKIYISE